MRSRADLRTGSRPTRPRKARRLGAALLVGTALALLAPLVGNVAPPASAPDIVILLTDDQRADSLAGMAAVNNDLARHGTTYPQTMVPTSQCCPSRATILSGRYAHHTTVWDNRQPLGGWTRAVASGLEKQTIATVLQDHGYRTGLFGKYFNGFGANAPADYVPPGWNRFTAFHVPNHSGAYFNYRLTGPDGGQFYGHRPRDYSTDVLARKAERFVRRTPSLTPLFVYLAPYGPHRPYTPAPRYVASRTPSTGARPLRAPTRAQVAADRAGKPAWVRFRKAVSPRAAALVAEQQRRTLLAVDDAVDGMVRALRRTGRLRNTLFVFMSDNGLMHGEHGLLGKNIPYDKSTRVPLVIRWDGHVTAGKTDQRLALNVDIARTVTRAAGVDMATDGVDLLGGRRRTGFVVEASRKVTADRPPYCGWRTPRYLFVHYDGGGEEFYDYLTDPNELHNGVADPTYQALVKTFRSKAKESCRPLPPNFHWN
jgi:N-acetylglucosamine-6-sulfatase